MKNFLKDLIAKKEGQRAQLVQRAKAATDINELRGINDQIDAINTEIAEARTKLDSIPGDPAGPIPGMLGGGAAGGGQGGQGGAPGGGGDPGAGGIGARSQMTPAQIVATYGLGGGVPAAGTDQRDEDPMAHFGTMEYRRAFMKFCQTGERSPELRLDAMTTVTEVSAVVPTTILNEVIRKLTDFGTIFSKVRKTSVPGGVQIPILTLVPTASWITEAAPSDRKKATANTSVTFSYYGLECKLAVSLLAGAVTLAGFETVLTDLVYEAMIKALEIAVIAGTGSGQPTGVTIDTRVPAAQIVTLGSDDFLQWDQWKKKVFAKMPLKYKGGAEWFMASGTFEGYIDGMVDANGQPVGRMNYNIADGPQERFGGKVVNQVEDELIAAYDDASTGDVVAILCNLKAYILNSNMQLSMFRYIDHDTNETIDKALLIADGKLGDPNGVVIVKKGA